jgi:hypothetical protein
METFEAARLLRVHPGPVHVSAGPSALVVRSLERYPLGVALLWTHSPGPARSALLAQGTPRVTVALSDDLGTAYAPLGDSSAGGGRTVFGASYFSARASADPAWVEAALTVTGATGGESVHVAVARLVLGP